MSARTFWRREKYLLLLPLQTEGNFYENCSGRITVPLTTQHLGQCRPALLCTYKLTHRPSCSERHSAGHVWGACLCLPEKCWRIDLNRYVFNIMLYGRFGEGYIIYCGPGSSVGIATHYGLEGPGSNPCGNEIFRPPRLVLGPTQPPIKWVPGLYRG